MRVFGRAALPLEGRLPLDAALEEAFGPLRARTANVGPARVRAAVRWAAPEPVALRGLTLVGRISDLSLAAVVSAFIFAGSVVSMVAVPAVPDVTRDAAVSATWELNGRLAFQPPVDPHAADGRMTVHEFAANGATVRRTEVPEPANSVRDSEPFAGRP